MYIPPYFNETDLARLDWLAGHDAFVTLISQLGGSPYATHLPVLYRREGSKVVLTGHWARPNPQWRDIESQRVLVIFHGPHAYISARWYLDAANQVPTWDYAVAHLYGRIRLLSEAEELERIVIALAQKYEQGAPEPWRYEAEHGRPQLRGIMGFEFEPDEMQLKFKLNQNHPACNIEAAAASLNEQGSDDSRALAALMLGALAKKQA